MDEKNFATNLDSKIWDAENGCLGKIRKKWLVNEIDHSAAGIYFLETCYKIGQQNGHSHVLCIIRANTNELQERKIKSEAKCKSAKVQTEEEKRWLSKETGPVKKEILVEEVIKKKVLEAGNDVRDDLEALLKEVKDVFPNKLPYGPPSKRIVEHEIETIASAPPP